jgi:hypothetical protein
MELHPDSRPENILEFRDALIGDRPITLKSISQTAASTSAFLSRTDQQLVLGALLLAGLTLLITLLG